MKVAIQAPLTGAFGPSRSRLHPVDALKMKVAIQARVGGTFAAFGPSCS